MAPQVIQFKNLHFVSGPLPRTHPSDLISLHPLLPTPCCQRTTGSPWQGLPFTEATPLQVAPIRGLLAITGSVSPSWPPSPAHSFLGPCSHFLSVSLGWLSSAWFTAASQCLRQDLLVAKHVCRVTLQLEGSRFHIRAWPFFIFGSGSQASGLARGGAGQ